MATTFVQIVIFFSLSLAQWGLNWLVQSFLLTAVGLGFARAVRQCGAATQSAIYQMTLMAVLLAPVASIFVGRLGFTGLSIPLSVIRITSSRSEIPHIPTQQSSISGGAVYIETKTEVTTTSTVGKISTALDSIDVSNRLQGAKKNPIDPISSDDHRTSYGTFSKSCVAFGLLWLIVSAIFFAQLVRSFLALRSLCRGSFDVEPETILLCDKLSCEIGIRAPVVRRSPFLSSPCAIGFLRPTILLSDDDTTLNVGDVLAHELAHVARRDGLWNLLRRLATSCLPMQPLIWRLSNRMEAVAEEICDDFAVSLGADPNQYAKQLCRLAALNLPLSIAAGMKTPKTELTHRIKRILDSTRPLSTKVGLRRGSAVVSTGIILTGLAGMVGAGDEKQSVRDKQPSVVNVTAVLANADDMKSESMATEDIAQQPLKFAGRVLDGDGKPLEGVKIFRALASGQEYAPIVHQQLATTGVDGRFDFELSTEAFFQVLGNCIDVIAIKPGYSLGWKAVSPSTENSNLIVNLIADELPIEGQIIDLEGHPVSEAIVQVTRIDAFANDDLRPHLQAIQKGQANPPIAKNILFLSNQPEDSAIQGASRTEKDGHFRLSGIGRNRLAQIVISGEGIETASVQVATQSLDEPLKLPPWQSAEILYGVRFTHRVRPSRPVIGRVTAFGTGNPVEGVRVSLLNGIPSAMTDADGRFELKGSPKAGEYKLFALPPKDLPYLAGSATVPGTPGITPVTAEIHVFPAVRVSGRVIDEVNGKAVAGTVTFWVLAPNKHLRPGLGSSAIGGFSVFSQSQTHLDGSFELNAIPGQGLIGVFAADRNSFEPVQLNAKEFFEKEGVPYGYGDDYFSGKDNSYLVVKDGINGNESFTPMPQSNFQGITLMNVPSDAKQITKNISVKSKTN